MNFCDTVPTHCILGSIFPSPLMCKHSFFSAEVSHIRCLKNNLGSKTLPPSIQSRNPEQKLLMEEKQPLNIREWSFKDRLTEMSNIVYEKFWKYSAHWNEVFLPWKLYRCSTWKEFYINETIWWNIFKLNYKIFRSVWLLGVTRWCCS